MTRFKFAQKNAIKHGWNLPVIPGAFDVPSHDLQALVSFWKYLLNLLPGNRPALFDKFWREKVDKVR